MGRNPSKEEIMNSGAVEYLVPIVGCIGVFSFLSISVWVDGRKKEREAFYKAETLRRITETSGDGAKAAMDLLREESRMERIKKREGLKIGGLICVAVGVAMVIFLHALTKTDPGAPFLVGLIPGLIGVALLAYVYWMAPPVE
jgi:hypothetical protein